MYILLSHKIEKEVVGLLYYCVIMQLYIKKKKLLTYQTIEKVITIESISIFMKERCRPNILLFRTISSTSNIDQLKS